MADEVFLDKWGLYKEYASEDYCSYGFKPSAINRFCENCNSERTFNPSSELLPIGDSVLKYITYKCAACRKILTFILYEGTGYFDQDDSSGQCFIMKVGQWPPWVPAIDNRFKKLLGENLSNYQKGLYCEQESFGIGAFAYYRRIVEDGIDGLINALYDMFTPEEKEKYKADLEKAKKERVAAKKIEIVKEILPSHLRPGGVNPLARLHSSLSAGLHGGSEKECLGIATDVRLSLEFLLKGLVETRKEKRDYAEAIRRLENSAKPGKE
jgi:hypothetical protein